MFQETELNFSSVPRRRGQQSTATVNLGPVEDRLDALEVAGVATITVPNKSFEHTQTLIVAGVLATNRIILGLAPCLDSDENCPEMLDIVSYVATPSDGAVTITATFSQPTSGPVKFNWSAA